MIIDSPYTDINPGNRLPPLVILSARLKPTQELVLDPFGGGGLRGGFGVVGVYNFGGVYQRSGAGSTILKVRVT